MPIRRKHDNDPDWMAKKQDKELIYLEERISALYEEASYQITEEYNRFYSNYQLEYERRLAMVESGEMSQDSFNTWCRNQIFQSNRYQAMISSLTDVLTNADVAAMAAVNEQLPYTLAESYDFISSLGFEAADKAGITMGTFQIYNADSVQAIIRDNPDLLPVVDLPEDERWNRNHINNEITQAIIQGDSMQQVARRLQSVAAMDDRAAIRNARTAMTAAENLGRSESARRLKEKGLPVKEVWSATKDSRTRNTHLLLDGTEKDEQGYYGADILAIPLRFPADPNGEPQEIYNCRCRENVQIAGIDHSRDDELYENFMRENYPDDWNELERRRADTSTGEGRRWQERQDALERQRRLREENRRYTGDADGMAKPKAAEGYTDANDLERAIMADGGGFDDPRLLAYSNTLDEENAYTTSMKNNLQQAINENGYTNGVRMAIEAEESDIQRYLDGLPELKTPEQIATAQAMQERLRILSTLKPAQADIVSAVSVQSSNDIELPSAVQRAFDAFEKKKQSAKNENYLALDANGNEIFSGTGRGRAVSVPEWANEQSERGYSIHNHPVDVIFSDQDIRNYEEYGLAGGFVITSGGNEYALFNLNPVSHHAEVQAIRRGTGEGYEEALPFSSAASRAFNEIEDDKLMRRRAYIDELNAQGLDRQTQRERLHEWEESEPSVSDRQIEWLEENAERYGFIFRRRRR